MLRAVLFDLDDTLIDWSSCDFDWALLERGYLQGVRQYFAEQGYDLDDFDAYCQSYRNRLMTGWTDARHTFRAPHIGRAITETAAEFGIPAHIAGIERCLEAYGWGVVPGTVVFPDAAEALKTLIENNIAVGIVTNAPQPMILRDLELTSHGLMEFFPTCRISAADAGFIKPHPMIFQAALDCLGVKSEEAVFVGDDLEADIYGSKQVGMRSVLRITRRTETMPRTDIVPDATVRQLTELPPILDEWFPDWRRERAR